MYKLVLVKTEEKRGPGYWKFNTKLLHDEIYVNKVNQILENIDGKYQNAKPDDRLELAIEDITKWSQKRSRAKAEERKQKIEHLTRRVEKLQKEMQTAKCLKATRAEHEVAVKKLENYVEEITQAAAFRAKCDYVQNYERSTKYFFNIEKARYNKKTMSSLKNEKTKLTITEPKAILKEQKNFYSELYTKNKKVCFILENKTNIKLTPEDREALDAPITMEELTEAVKSLKRQKAPGLTGLPAEFYQFFWSKIKELFHKAIEYAFKEKGYLHLTARRGVISLIPKKSKDPMFLKNWRPLTLLATGYKILAKVLANRIKTVLPYIISENQSGFMESRQISKTLRTTIDILQYGASKKITGYLLSIDFHKCFDKIEYQSILSSLDFFNFGPNYQRWVSLLLNNFQSCTTNNGEFSEFFDVTRLCHQGCPLACYLFLICGEVMAIQIKENSNIHGIKLNDLKHVIEQFADDTQLFLDTEKSLKNVIRTLKNVETNIGLTVNFEKTSVHSLGEAKICNSEENLVWDPGGLVVLGIDVKKDSDEIYTEIVKKASKVMQNWENKTLTLTGKVLIVNTLVASLFVYAMQVPEDPTEKIYQQLYQHILSYLWGNKKSKVSLETLMKGKDQGGLALRDFRVKNATLKASWVLCTDQFMQSQLNIIVPKILGSLFWNCELNKKDAATLVKNKNVNCFWKQLVIHWFDIKHQTCHVEKMQQIIWLNSKIRINDKVVLFPKAIENWLIKITDLYKNKSQLFSTEELIDKYKLTWLQAHSLKSAISCKQNKNTKNGKESINIYCTEIENYYGILSVQKRKVDYMYKNVIAAKSMKNIEYDKMSRKIELEKNEYVQAFKNIYKVTNVTKYRDFQYRLLVDAIHTNDRLYYWKKVTSQQCEICGMAKQTIKHLLWECHCIQKIWTQTKAYIDSWLDPEQQRVLEYNDITIFLNLVHPKAGHISNFIVLIVKQYIYAQKCLGQPIKFLDIVYKIENMYQIERYNASKTGKQKKHNEKWSSYNYKNQ